VATLYEVARYGNQRTNNNCLARGNDLETEIKPFYDFEARRELNGGDVVECCYAMRKKLSAIRREGDGAIVIFGVAGQRMSGLCMKHV